MPETPDLAPPGFTWVCGACGKNGPDRMQIGDVSCYVNAVLCYAEKRLSPESGRWLWWYAEDPNPPPSARMIDADPQHAQHYP